MKDSCFYNLKPGDQLVEAIFASGMVKHFAVYLGCLLDGQEWVVENHHISNGVRLLSLNEYKNSNRDLVRIDRFVGDDQARQQVVLRALQLVNQPYDLLSYNCEHFANQVTTGKARSKQIENLLALVLLFVLGKALIHN